MKTLYVDVYFLINFVVDFFALYFSLGFSHLKTNSKRLVLSALVGAAFAIVDLFLPSNGWLRIGVALFSLALISFLAVRRGSFFVRVRVCSVFFVSQLLIGGGVYYGYGLLDRFLLKHLDSSGGGAENRAALYFSVIILLAIGVVKLLITILSDTNKEKSATVKLVIGSRQCELDALVDTGNLVKDPLSMTPVMFIKRAAASRIIPRNVLELENIDSLDKDYRKRIRLIPVTRAGETHVLTGLRADRITVCIDGKTADVEMTLAIDKEEGSFGGYDALIPGLNL